jgi:hypothetical protein
MFKKKKGIYFKFSVSFICLSLHILVFLFHHFLTTKHKRSEDGDEPMNQPIEKMVNQYFRWRCELLDNRPIQGEFSEDNWKW